MAEELRTYIIVPEDIKGRIDAFFSLYRRKIVLSTHKVQHISKSRFYGELLMLGLNSYAVQNSDIMKGNDG